MEVNLGYAVIGATIILLAACYVGGSRSHDEEFRKCCGCLIWLILTVAVVLTTYSFQENVKIRLGNLFKQSRPTTAERYRQIIEEEAQSQRKGASCYEQ